MKRILGGIAAGLLASFVILQVIGLARGQARAAHAAGRGRRERGAARIAIHYAPCADRVALGVWKQLFAVLPAHVDVEVEVTAPADFDRLIRLLRGTPAPRALHPVSSVRRSRRGRAIATPRSSTMRHRRDPRAAADRDAVRRPRR